MIQKIHDFLVSRDIEFLVHEVVIPSEGKEDTLYIYSEGNSLVHWTYKESQCGVSYLPTAN